MQYMQHQQLLCQKFDHIHHPTVQRNTTPTSLVNDVYHPIISYLHHTEKLVQKLQYE